jgi:HK97 family phage major capsid protein
MSKSLELKQQRVPLAARMRELVKDSADKGWSNEARAEFDKLEKEIDRLGAAAVDAERAEKSAAYGDAIAAGIDEQRFEEKKNRADITMDMRANALRAWCFGDNPSMIRDEWRDHAKACGVDLNSPEFKLKLWGVAPRNEADLRQRIRDNITYRATTAQSTTAAAGGNTIADDNSLMANVERALLAFGGQRNVSRVIRTDNGADLPIPLSDDTGTSAAILTEGSTVTIQSLSFGSLVLQSHKYSSYVVASAELLSDTAIDMAAFVGQAFGERLARGTNAHFTTGDGSSKPTGALKNATAVAKSTDGIVSYPSLVNLVNSIDPLYAASDSFAVQCSQGVYGELRKLVDSNKQPIFNVVVAEGAPDRILGVPININQSMVASSTVAASPVIAAGDFSRHIIRDVSDLRIRRLDERLALSDQVGFVAFSRHDSGLTVSSTVAAASQPIKALKTT